MANKVEKSEVQKFIETAPTGKSDTVNFNNIVDWCKETNNVQWLKDYKANHNRIIFFALRKAFYETFFPARVSSKPKKPSMSSIIDAL